MHATRASHSNSTGTTVEGITLMAFETMSSLQLIQQQAMGYGDLSHTEVNISREAKLRGMYETEVWDESHIPWMVVE